MVLRLLNGDWSHETHPDQVCVILFKESLAIHVGSKIVGVLDLLEQLHLRSVCFLAELNKLIHRELAFEYFLLLLEGVKFFFIELQHLAILGHLVVLKLAIDLVLQLYVNL